MARPMRIQDAAILEATRPVFLKHGYKVSSTRLARAAGISEGSLFKHFKSKTALFLAAMKMESDEPAWQDRLQEAAGKDDIQRTLEFAGAQLLRHQRLILPRIMMVRASGITLHGDYHPQGEVPHHVQLVRHLADYFSAEMKAGRLAMQNPESQAHAFVGALTHYAFCETVYNYRPAPPERFVQTVVATILCSARAAKGHSRASRNRKVISIKDVSL